MNSNNNKVCVDLIVPGIEERYNVFIPVNKKTIEIIFLLNKAVNDMTNGAYAMSEHLSLISLITCLYSFVISSSNPKASDILFCITPSNRGGYNVHTIPKEKNTHITRLDLPSSWGGLVDLECRHPYAQFPANP